MITCYVWLSLSVYVCLNVRHCRWMVHLRSRHHVFIMWHKIRCKMEFARRLDLKHQEVKTGALAELSPHYHLTRLCLQIGWSRSRLDQIGAHATSFFEPLAVADLARSHGGLEHYANKTALQDATKVQAFGHLCVTSSCGRLVACPLGQTAWHAPPRPSKPSPCPVPSQPSWCSSRLGACMHDCVCTHVRCICLLQSPTNSPLVLISIQAYMIIYLATCSG